MSTLKQFPIKFNNNLIIHLLIIFVIFLSLIKAVEVAAPKVTEAARSVSEVVVGISSLQELLHKFDNTVANISKMLDKLPFVQDESGDFIIKATIEEPAFVPDESERTIIEEPPAEEEPPLVEEPVPAEEPPPVEEPAVPQVEEVIPEPVVEEPLPVKQETAPTTRSITVPYEREYIQPQPYYPPQFQSQCPGGVCAPGLPNQYYRRPSFNYYPWR